MEITKKVVYALRFKDGTEKQLDEYEVNQLRNTLMVSDDWRISAMRGMKIDAIKRVREITSAGLKEAKDAVEKFVAESPEVAAHRLVREGRQAFERNQPPIVQRPCQHLGCGPACRFVEEPPPPDMTPPPPNDDGFRCSDPVCCPRPMYEETTTQDEQHADVNDPGGDDIPF